MQNGMLPAGTYYAVAKGAGLGLTGTGKEQVAVEFEITTAEFIGQRITWYGFFTEKTTARTLESLRYAGLKGNDISDLSDLSREDTPVVEIVVEHDTYNGKTSAKVAWVNRQGGGGLRNALPADAAKAFAARMRGALAVVDTKIKAEKSAGTNGKKPPAGPPPGHPASDDIPF